MSIALCQNIARFLIAFLPGAIRNLSDFYMHGFCTLNSCCFFTKKRHLNGILGSLCCIFHLLQNLHHLPSILGFLPNFSCLFCWHFRTFCRAFHTFYWAFTPFAELSHLLPSLNAFCWTFALFIEFAPLSDLFGLYRVARLPLYSSPHSLFPLCAICSVFCVICILRHAICAFSHAIYTFSHTICAFNQAICAIFPYY